MKLSAALALMGLGVAVSGCATIIDGSSEKIGITTGAVTGAHCVLSNGRGQWSVVTPGKVTVERSKHDMKVTCSKQGYQDVAATIPSDIDGWTLVNFAFANLPGLGVDAWTGAINDYDDTTTVHMSQGYGAESAYPSYPSEPNYPPVQQQAAPQTPPPAYLDSSPSYPQPTQPMNDQPQSYPDNSYPDNSYPDNSQSPPDNSQSYPDNSQSAPGSLPPL